MCTVLILVAEILTLLKLHPKLLLPEFPLSLHGSARYNWKITETLHPYLRLRSEVRGMSYPTKNDLGSDIHDLSKVSGTNKSARGF
jgi:hypothetical protein